MCKKYSEEDLNSMDHAAKNDVIYQMQECETANCQRS